MGKKCKPILNSRLQTLLLKNQWFMRLYNIMLSCFDWQNLPDSCDERFIEKVLNGQGLNVWFLDEVLGLLAMPTMAAGPLNIYDYPTVRTAYANNGVQWYNLDDSNSVLCYNNYARTPVLDILAYYAERLGEIDRVIDVNLNAQKTPIILSCDETERLTLANAYKQYENNSQVIFGTKGTPSLQVYRTDAPYICGDLQDLKRQLWAEALIYIGVEANPDQKAERLITSEVSSTLGQVEAQRISRLNARQQACEKINKMFGTDIWVEWRSSLQLANIMSGDSDEMEGVENGILHATDS